MTLRRRKCGIAAQAADQIFEITVGRFDTAAGIDVDCITLYIVQSSRVNELTPDQVAARLGKAPENTPSFGRQS